MPVYGGGEMEGSGTGRRAEQTSGWRWSASRIICVMAILRDIALYFRFADKIESLAPSFIFGAAQLSDLNVVVIGTFFRRRTYRTAVCADSVRRENGEESHLAGIAIISYAGTNYNLNA